VAPPEAPFVRDGAEQPRPEPATPLGSGLVPYVKVALPWKLTPTAVEESLSDGETVGSFRVIATPGHTAGHVSLLWQDRGVLFRGRRRGEPDPRRAASGLRRSRRGARLLPRTRAARLRQRGVRPRPDGALRRRGRVPRRRRVSARWRPSGSATTSRRQRSSR
jgi:glyoxylase-like metal-dependent hydrolase (beta-lactamase superfamily II)